jgi:hypothetical protein
MTIFHLANTLHPRFYGVALQGVGRAKGLGRMNGAGRWEWRMKTAQKLNEYHCEGFSRSKQHISRASHHHPSSTDY